jgi:hypothetical protein
MDWQHLAPYFAPLLVVGLILWRAARAKPRPVKPAALWIRPLILTLIAGAVLATTPFPSWLALAGFVVAAAAGAGVGHAAGRAVHMSVHPETGVLESRATPIATAIIVGLFAIRYGVRLMFPQMNVAAGGRIAAGVLQVTEGLLIFTTAMVIAQSATLWVRARPLLAAHRAGDSGGAVEPPP